MIFDSNLGPIMTIGAIFPSLLILPFALIMWISGHIMWLIQSDKEMSDWLSKYVRERSGFSDPAKYNPQTDNPQTDKRIGWGIILGWGLFILFVITPPYEPIIGRFRLLNITACLFNIATFLIVITLFKWFAEKR